MNFLKIRSPLRWYHWTMILAGIYNIVWGSWVIFFPNTIFKTLKMTIPIYPEIWQCVGMIVAVYGLGYLVAARNPFLHWPIVLVGFLGKVFGPIGFAGALYNEIFPLTFGINIIFNDLIWWVPFGLILYKSLAKKDLKETIRISKEDFKGFEDKERARFINSLSGFKSSNLIGTIDKSGQTNLSIISSAFHLGASPALIGFIIRPDSAPRHTLDNLRNNRACTLNHVNLEIVEKSHQTSARYQKEVSEFDACDLGEEFLNDFKAPFVAQSKVKLALVMEQEIKMDNGTHLIICKIEDVYLPKNVLDDDGSVHIDLAGSLSVSGLDKYHEACPVGRLSYAKPDKPLKWI